MALWVNCSWGTKRQRKRGCIRCRPYAASNLSPLGGHNDRGSYGGDWVTRAIRRRGEPTFDDLDAVLEFDALDDFRQLIFAFQSSPCFRSGVDKFEHHKLGRLRRQGSLRPHGSMTHRREHALDRVCNRYEDHGACSYALDRFGPGIWCDHPGRGAPGARQWAGRCVR